MDNTYKRSRSENKPYTFGRSYSAKRQRNSHSGGSIPSKMKSTGGAPVYILDSGAYSIKVGHSSKKEPAIIPNCIMKAKSERKRPFIGDQVEDCRDLSGLYYLLPCEKGYITKWDVQKPVWDYVFQRHSIADEPIIMTQPIYNFRSIQECIDEIFFEEYEVKSMYRATVTDLAHYEYVKNVKGSDVSCVVIDSGYSFTHIVPYINGKKYYPGIVRISLGGKLLTNYLKDIISYRQLHVMEETYVINQVKEDTCFVSTNLKEDMRIASYSGEENSIVRNYVLPDFNNVRRGYIQELGSEKSEIIDGCQILRLNNERFTVPELLIHPSNIGMESMGIAEAVTKSILSCPAAERAILSENIVLIGGNSQFPGYKERLHNEIRSLLPTDLNISVYKPENGIIFPWKGGQTLANDQSFKTMLVSKSQYEEYGSQFTYKKFNDWSTSEIEVKTKEIEVKPTKVSLMQNMKGLNLFGKVDDDEVEVASENPTVDSQAGSVTNNNGSKKAGTDLPTNENKLIALDVRHKLVTANAIRLDNLRHGLQLGNGTKILPENLAIRFVPVSEIYTTRGNILTPANVKFV